MCAPGLLTPTVAVRCGKYRTALSRKWLQYGARVAHMASHGRSSGGSTRATHRVVHRRHMPAGLLTIVMLLDMRMVTVAIGYSPPDYLQVCVCVYVYAAGVRARALAAVLRGCKCLDRCRSVQYADPASGALWQAGAPAGPLAPAISAMGSSMNATALFASRAGARAAGSDRALWCKYRGALDVGAKASAAAPAFVAVAALVASLLAVADDHVASDVADDAAGDATLRRRPVSAGAVELARALGGSKLSHVDMSGEAGTAHAIVSVRTRQ